MKFKILNKVFGSGSAPARDRFAFLALVKDIDYFPSTDSLGVLLLEDIKMKENCGMMQIYLTSSSQEYSYEMVGDSDSKSFKVKFTGTHPGTEQQALEFSKNFVEEEFVVLIPQCNKGIKVLGSPGSPLIFTSSHKSVKDSEKFNFIFEQEVGSEQIYMLYDGIITLNTNIDIDMKDFLELLKGYIKIDGSNLTDAQKLNLRNILGVGGGNLGNSDLSLSENRSFNLKTFFLNFFSNVGLARVGINKNNPTQALDVVGNIKTDGLILAEGGSPEEVGSIKRIGDEIHFKTSSGWDSLLLKGDYISDSHGVIYPDTLEPVDGWKIGWYTPKISAVEPGTNYPNQGNQKSIENYFTEFYFNGTTWETVSKQMPTSKAFIPAFSTMTFPLSGDIQVTYNDRFWQLIDGKTALATDIPTDDSLIWENLGSVPLDIVNGALSYNSAKKVLGGFIQEDADETITIDETKILYGGNFLTNDNTYFTNGNYPNIGVIYNYPIGDAKLLRVLNIKAMQNPTKPEYATILGVKNGVVIVLMDGVPLNSEQLHEYDVTGFQTVSFQILGDTTFPTIELVRHGLVTVDVHKYVDERFKVLQSFLEPEETIWQDLAMPQPNENQDAIISTGWGQYPAVGSFNGIINIADLPDDFTILEIDGNFDLGGDGTLWLGGINNDTLVYDNLLSGSKGVGKKVFEVDRTKYKSYVYSRVLNSQKFRIGKKIKLPIEKDSVKNYIDNHISTGSSISNEKTAQIERPKRVLRLDFSTYETLPISKGVVISGKLLITDMEGLNLVKFASMEVQGSSSAVYPKKNWTFAMFNDEAKTEAFKLRVGNWAEHSEFVFKSNWIDATHCRNILSNQIWEDIIQNRVGYPKRENEVAYAQSYTEQIGRFDSGALTHVDGIPAELYINEVFYGIGNFNLGKKRENYDLVSSNQNHIQLSAEVHVNLNAYSVDDWEIRNPKTPDANFLSKINPWFASNALSGQAFKDAFENHHDLKNAIDFFLLSEFIQSPDMYDKNFILTSWDGVKFYFLPYDMDTTFGLQWDGRSFTGHTSSIKAISFWNKFYSAYSIEIKARYLDLKNKGVFTLDNVYRKADLFNKTFGLELFKKEQDKWIIIPSNSTIYTGFPQIYEWTKNRIIWLDSQYL